MKIHTKALNGLAVLMVCAQAQGKTQSLITIADRLGCSKLYLEHVLTELKAHQWVQSIKGPQGGYRIHPQFNGSLLDVLSVLESAWVQPSLADFKDPSLNHVLDTWVLKPLTLQLNHQLNQVSILDLANALQAESMYYI